MLANKWAADSRIPGSVEMELLAQGRIVISTTHERARLRLAVAGKAAGQADLQQRQVSGMEAAGKTIKKEQLQEEKAKARRCKGEICDIRKLSLQVARKSE